MDALQKGLRAVEAYFTMTDQACALWWCLAALSRTQHTFACTLARRGASVDADGGKVLNTGMVFTVVPRGVLAALVLCASLSVVESFSSTPLAPLQQVYAHTCTFTHKHTHMYAYICSSIYIFLLLLLLLLRCFMHALSCLLV